MHLCALSADCTTHYIVLSPGATSVPASRAWTACASALVFYLSTWTSYLSTLASHFSTWTSYFSAWTCYFPALTADASALACLSFKVPIADSTEGGITSGRNLNLLPFSPYPRTGNRGFPTFNWALRWSLVTNSSTSHWISARFPALW